MNRCEQKGYPPPARAGVKKTREKVRKMGRKTMEYPVCSGEMFVLSIMLFVSVASVAFGYVQGCVGAQETVYLNADITANAFDYNAESFYIPANNVTVYVEPFDPDEGLVYILSDAEMTAFRAGPQPGGSGEPQQDIDMKTSEPASLTLLKGKYWAVVDNNGGSQAETVHVKVYVPAGEYDGTKCGGPDPPFEPAHEDQQQPFIASPGLPGGMALFGVALGAMFIVKLK